jgi:hypothetical protein
MLVYHLIDKLPKKIYSHFKKACGLQAGLFFIFLDADTALYIG